MIIIAATGDNNEIGREGDLCWHIREDLAYFKAKTMEHPVIMGRKTWESLPKRPLTGRLNIVVTSRAKDYAETEPTGNDGPIWVSSLEEALKRADALSEAEPYVIGGAKLYEAALPLADRLELTHIFDTDPEADTFFPTIDPTVWQLEQADDMVKCGAAPPFRHETWRRK